LKLDDAKAKKVFLRETIDKEVRLSYLERIQRTLPEEYFAVFPEKAGVDDWKDIAGIPHTT
jgi:MIF4G like